MRVEKEILGMTKVYVAQLIDGGEREIFLCSEVRRAKVEDSKKDRLKQFYLKIKNCQKCILGRTRTHFVFGEGNPEAKLVFIGEAPGYEEDIHGKPFVGQAGQLLTRIIESIQLKREDVYICNILKCRPPGNRSPLPTEIEKCKPHLFQQLKIIEPKIICALGTFAAQTLLETKVSISEMRGKIYYYQNIKVIPTYHPAALLRNTQWKKYVWEDMKFLKKEYEKES